MSYALPYIQLVLLTSHEEAHLWSLAGARGLVQLDARVVVDWE